MKEANGKLTEEALLRALEALVGARSDPQLERCYSILLFKRANGERIDTSVLTGLDELLTDAGAHEFLTLVQLL